MSTIMLKPASVDTFASVSMLLKLSSSWFSTFIRNCSYVHDGRERGQPTGSNGCSVRIRGSPPAGSEREEIVTEMVW